MGGVSVTLAESGISGWSSPGMLAFDDRWRLTGTETQLVPDIADDVWLRSLLVSGKLARPIPLTLASGYARLGFGRNVFSDESFDRAINFSIATSLWKTVGLGATWEHVHSKRVSPSPELQTVEGDADARSISFGFAVQREFVVRSDVADAGRLVVAPVAAVSLLHWGEDVEYNDEDLPEELARHLHIGAGVRVAHEPRSSSQIFDPARLSQFSLSAGIEHTIPKFDDRYRSYDPGYSSESDDDESIAHYGVELTMCGLLSARYGRIDDPDGGITNNTWGVGLGFENTLPFDARIDYASFPQADGLDRVDRWDFMVSFNPALLPRN